MFKHLDSKEKKFKIPSYTETDKTLHLNNGANHS